MKLWLALRDRRLAGFKFVRQVTIGPYIADFACRAGNLVIELDGGQHAESVGDRTRDAFLTSQGFRVVRFWNPDVLKNLEGVLEIILIELGKRK